MSCKFNLKKYVCNSAKNRLFSFVFVVDGPTRAIKNFA